MKYKRTYSEGKKYKPTKKEKKLFIPKCKRVKFVNIYPFIDIYEENKKANAEKR